MPGGGTADTAKSISPETAGLRSQRVATCRLKLSERRWGFADDRRDDIELHWRRRLAENPGFFNGKVLVMEPPRIVDGELSAELIETDFASFLFWKDSGYPDLSVRDGFGSALIRSLEGHVLLARQGPGHVNSGLLYLPGGFIDRSDILGDGRIDIDGSIAREFREETDIDADSFERRPGYLVTQNQAQVSIAIEFQSRLPAVELRQMLLSQLQQQECPELEDFVIFRRPPEAGQRDVVAFSRHAVSAVLGGV